MCLFTHLAINKTYLYRMQTWLGLLGSCQREKQTKKQASKHPSKCSKNENPTANLLLFGDEAVNLCCLKAMKLYVKTCQIRRINGPTKIIQWRKYWVLTSTNPQLVWVQKTAKGQTSDTRWGDVFIFSKPQPGSWHAFQPKMALWKMVTLSWDLPLWVYCSKQTGTKKQHSRDAEWTSSPCSTWHNDLHHRPLAAPPTASLVQSPQCWSLLRTSCWCR